MPIEDLDIIQISTNDTNRASTKKTEEEVPKILPKQNNEKSQSF